MRTREKFSFLKSLIALALIVLCFIAAEWQYSRGVDRHQRNFLIKENIAAPEMILGDAASDLTKNEWRTVNTEGVFDASQTIFYAIDTSRVNMVLNFSRFLQVRRAKNSGLIAVGLLPVKML